jgi:hypothetical protein
MSASDVLPATGGLAEVGSAAPAQRLAVAWQHPESRAIRPVGILQLAGHVYSYYYVRAVREVVDFRPFIGFPDLYGRYESDYLFPIFAQRVMDPGRPDYERYVDSLDLTQEASPWEQLARSEGRRAGDTIILFPEPRVDADGSTYGTFLVHGLRHATEPPELIEERLRGVRQGDRLWLKDEPTNPVNPEAIQVANADGEVLGWVPDMLLGYVRCVRSQGDPEVHVVQINGPDAPMHMRLLARLSGRAPDGYRAFGGPDWEPLSR